MNVHVYTAGSQPATRYWDAHLRNGQWRRCRRRRLWYTDCCRVRRWAAYVRVQVYYDTMWRTCAPGHGCTRRP